MGADYYKILEVDKNAKADDLTKAYRKLVKQFQQISKAYEVLSDPQKRAVYDQYGEEGLRGQVPPPDATGGTSYFSTGDIPTSSRFNSRGADDIFAKFFGDYSPSGSLGSGGGGMRGSSFSSGMFGDDIFGSFGEGLGGGSMHQTGPRKDPPIENRLPCSLEELYKGANKKMKISRDIVDASGKTMQVQEVLTIDIKPGWKKGTKITFAQKGNARPNVVPADLVFIIDEKPHPVFTRDGNDLIITQKISSAEALTGYTVHVTTLDGRSLPIPINTVIHESYEKVVPREGMPIQNEPTNKGNLRIKFDIKFLKRLTSEQQAGIKRILDL